MGFDFSKFAVYVQREMHSGTPFVEFHTMKQNSNEEVYSVERILDAAEIEFGKYGINGISVSAVSRRANVSSQLIYHYFSNKNNLYTEIIIRMTERFFSGYENLISESSEGFPLRSIHNFAYKFCDFFITNPEMGRLVLDQILREDPGPTRDVKAEPRMQKVFANLSKAIQAGVAAGSVKHDLTAEGVFFLTIVLTVGYTTVIGLLDRLHLEVPELAVPHDVREIVADAVIGAIGDRSTYGVE